MPDTPTLFVCKVNYTKPLDEIEKLLDEHRAYLKEGYARGVLLASGPMIPRVGGMIIARFSSMDEAVEFGKNDPFCIHDLADYEIVEFQAVLSDGCIHNFLSK